MIDPRSNLLFFLALCAYVCVVLSNMSKSYPHKEAPPPVRGSMPNTSKEAETLRGEAEALRAGIMLAH